VSKCIPKELTVQAVRQAMEQHDGLIHAFIQRQGGGDISYEEALQAGRIGLWRAIQGYDPTRGTAFSTYAWVAIYRHVHRRANELNRDTHVEVRERSAAWVLPDPVEALERKMIIHALHDLVNQLPQQMRRIVIGRYGLGMQPLRTLNELGEQLGLSGERVRQLQQEALAWLRHPAHSWRLRQLVGKNTASDYRQALAQNAALRRARRKTR
jgi:RNA polymerase sigma factor (sigma-70 family)